jgi:hypothetical protein
VADRAEIPAVVRRRLRLVADHPRTPDVVRRRLMLVAGDEDVGEPVVGPSGG